MKTRAAINAITLDVHSVDQLLDAPIGQLLFDHFPVRHKRNITRALARSQVVLEPRIEESGSFFQASVTLGIDEYLGFRL